jgi:hypothetical protein
MAAVSYSFGKRKVFDRLFSLHGVDFSAAILLDRPKTISFVSRDWTKWQRRRWQWPKGHPSLHPPQKKRKKKRGGRKRRENKL